MSPVRQHISTWVQLLPVAAVWLAVAAIPAPALAQTNFQKRVTSSSDDAYEGSGGSMNLTDSRIKVGPEPWDGFRFTNVTIPQGAAIVSAKVQLVANATSSEALGDFNPLFESATIPLAHANPDDLVDNASTLKSPQGKVESVPSAQMLLVIDFPDRVALIRQFVRSVDLPTARTTRDGSLEESAGLRVAAFRPQFLTALSLKESVTSLLSTEGKATVIEKDNRLVVYDTVGRLDAIGQMVNELDVPRAQVRITALIYDISLVDLERLGINWGSAVKWRHDGAGDPQSAPNWFRPCTPGVLVKPRPPT